MQPRAQPSLTTLILLTGLSVLSLNMFLPSLANMAEGFGVSYALISVSLGGYLTVSAVLQLIMGPLSDMYGRRPVMLAGLVLFTLASVGCWLAQDIWLFLMFRVLQGGIVTGMVLSRAIVRDIAPPEEATRLLGMIGTAMALAPLLGPMLGGFLDEFFGWRSNFLAFALMGGVMLVITYKDLAETNFERAESFTAQFKTYPTLFKDPLFWAYAICLTGSVAGFYVFLGGSALVGEAMFGLTPGQLGIGLGSISGGFMFGNFLIGRLSGRISPHKLMLWGRISASFGPLLAMAVLALGWVHPVVLYSGAVFVGFGNGLTLPGANAGVMSVNPRLAGSASGLSGALTILGGALATSGTAIAVATSWGAYALLLLMSLTSFAGLLAVLWIMRLGRF